jgi:hypothetical protein
VQGIGTDKKHPGSPGVFGFSRYYFVAAFARVRIALVEIRILTPFTRFVWRLILNFRRVAILEWLRELPDLVPRPVI